MQSAGRIDGTMRTTIGIFGATNSGKSTLVNMLTGQNVSIVSEVAGTTTDPVAKTIELNGVGPCVIIDTAGYDDTTVLGGMRVSKTKEVLRRCDIALFVISSRMEKKEIDEAMKWAEMIRQRVPQTIVVKNYFEGRGNDDEMWVNAHTGENRERLLREIGFTRERVKDERTIVTHLAEPGDTVLLVMPQDTQAPAGRLILPQVQTIRELLDYGCVTVCTNTDGMEQSLKALAKKPDLIITDSQAFKYVYEHKPEGTPLTSFSVLMARWKGDISAFIEGTKAFARLNAKSKVLIAEACTHAPLAEDIGREKIPALIRSRIDPDIRFDIVSGKDWTENLTDYDLVIHCGGCMINRAEMMARIKSAQEAGVAITNYGVAIAYFTKILDKIIW